MKKAVKWDEAQKSPDAKAVVSVDEADGAPTPPAPPAVPDA